MMMRFFLRSKIHRATATDAGADGDCAITIDQHLMNAAAILPFEKVEIFNLTSGSRFETWAIEGAAGSGIVASRHASAGDVLVIACYGALHEGQILSHKPRLVFVDGSNRVETVAEA
jgi:aspartate 1-decarboxylase